MKDCIDLDITMALNPHQKNKVDVSVSHDRECNFRLSATNFMQSLTEEEQKLFRLYGKLPNKKDLLQNKLQVALYICSATEAT